jgi:hypothetical protein
MENKLTYNEWMKFIHIQRNRVSANLRLPKKLGGVHKVK